MTTEDRYDRQLSLFGRAGQEKLRGLRVAIVGAGGLGSHLIQQLAFLGVGMMYVIDPDIVTASSLNRLVGACHDDSSRKAPKVEVARRLVETIDPSVGLVPIQKNLVSAEAFEAVKKSDYVLGCVDSDGPRIVLTDLCAAYQRPYFDLATEIPAGNPMDFGGRVCFSHEGDGCLYCLGLLSEEEIRNYFMSPEQRQEVAALYGVPQDTLGSTGPSVVTLNGVVASLVATEFMLQATGLRKANRLLFYRGQRGIVTVSADQPHPDCYYCKSVCGSGAAANVERYLNQHGGMEGKGLQLGVGA